MKSGFMFKGRSSNEFGVDIQTKNRTMLPSVKNQTYGVPNMDGDYDMTEANEYGRAFYEDRVFEVTMHIYGDNLAELERKAAGIASWLTGKGLFKFDDMSSSYNARVISNVAFTPERHGKKADVSVIFQSEAIGRADFDVSDGICLKNDVLLDSNIPLDMSGYFTKQLSAGKNYIEFVNIGDFYVRPVFNFHGSKNVTLWIYSIDYIPDFPDAGKKITVETNTGRSVVSVDFEKCEATDGFTPRLADQIQGKFFEFPPGISKVGIYTDEKCTLYIKYVPRTIYDFDFSQTDWGDGNA